MGNENSTEEARKAAQHGGYSIEKKLGRGAFGEVYLAKSVYDRKEVAIKLFKTEKSAFQEAQTLQSLSSPYIVKMIKFYGFDISYANRVFAVVMEYCAHGDLGNYLSSCRPKKEQRLIWYVELAAGLKYIHQKGITHCDIKPGNILITDRFHLKLGDVGIAKAAYDLGANSSKEYRSFEHYYINEYARTKPYMAPEVYDRQYKHTSDVFSLGLVFVMIAETPNPLLPVINCKSKSGPQWLGEFLHVNGTVRSDPIHLLAMPFKYPSRSEMYLFNDMVKYDHKKRPTASEVETCLRAMFDSSKMPDPSEVVNVVLPERSTMSWDVIGKGAVVLGVLALAGFVMANRK